MRTLAIECATEACSVALFEGDRLLAGEFRVLGRGHAEYLVPMIGALPDRGRAKRIVVSLGPGSFTGVRIGLAAARALGIAWSAEVLGYPTLALVAAMAREQRPIAATICMSGGHGEWFIQNFGTDGMPEQALVSQKPVDAESYPSHELIAGTQAEALLERKQAGRAVQLLPDARRFAELPDSLLTISLAPLYGRAPDAKLPGQVQ